MVIFGSVTVAQQPQNYKDLDGVFTKQRLKEEEWSTEVEKHYLLKG